MTSAPFHGRGWHRVAECAGNSSLAELGRAGLKEFRDSQDCRLWLWLLESRGELLGAWKIPRLWLQIGSTALAGLGGTWPAWHEVVMSPWAGALPASECHHRSGLVVLPGRDLLLEPAERGEELPVPG